MGKQLSRRSNAEERNNKAVAKKLIKSIAEKLHRSWKTESSSYDQQGYVVPEDVKEGHFAVMAIDYEEEPRRFVVPLRCLSHPRFVRLLEQAAEEYGFSHEGALEIPCGPAELKRILADLCL